MKRMELWFRNHKRIAAALILSFFLLLTCSSFPVYNLTKDYPATLEFTVLFVNLSVYGYLGAFLTRLCPRARFWQIFLIQIALILGGMLCRYLLEYGEVSNTYNFTPANIVLHLAVAMTVTTLGWLWSRRNPR
ncbi:MAG: hypothetical protein IKB09_00505 [Oscillospiraceae bacterium]|nr:hypothetical protein [Oscillospiraceae bacterium]